jgi:hypothetical protein
MHFGHNFTKEGWNGAESSDYKAVTCLMEEDVRER